MKFTNYSCSLFQQDSNEDIEDNMEHENAQMDIMDINSADEDDGHIVTVKEEYSEVLI